MLKLILVALIACFATAAAAAEKRVALVIGNGAYEHADKLSNPTIDSRAMRAALEKLGFKVVYGENLSKRETERSIGSFSTEAQDADVALAYYAGHGATFDARPYIVPVDARFDALNQMRYELVPLEDMIAELRGAKGIRIAIVDACRDNSAEQQLKRVAARGGTVSRGLARVDAPDGLIVAYATAYNTIAADGIAGGNSPFTAALLENLPVPGLDIKDVFFRSSAQVVRDTNRQQRPEIAVSLYENFSLVPTAAPSSASSPTAPRTPGDTTSEPGQSATSAALSPVPSLERARRANTDITSAVLIEETIDRLYEQNFNPGEQGSKEIRVAIEGYEKYAGLAPNGRATEGLLDNLREAKPLRPWGAIAFSSDGTSWGMAWSSPTRRQAEAVAKTQCGIGKCTLQLAFFGPRCGALAVSKQNWSMTWRVGGEATRKAALAECQRERGACRLIGSVCADGSEKTK